MNPSPITRRVSFRHAIALIVGLALAGVTLRAADNVPLPPHPRLLLNAAGIAQLKERIAAAPWAADEWKALAAKAERELDMPVELPPRGGNWSHNYVCPTHGARLKLDRKIGPWEWEHICPVGDHVLRGDPAKAELDFDGNGIARAHGNLAGQIVDNGLVYQMTGDVRYAARAREILLAYADRYLTYELHDNQGRKGRGARVASQSLSEASWLIPVTQGADLVWATLSAEDQKRITDGLLMAALNEVILPANLGIHNIRCWLNSAVGLVGFLLDDRALIARAIDEEKGYLQQLAKGVLDDGMWTEGSGGYHFFTIRGLLPLAEAARNCGRELYTPKFQMMFDAPLAFARPDLVLPDFNDSHSLVLQSQAELYELALARFHNPAYAPLLQDRRGRMALLFGVINLPSAQATGLTEQSSRNFPASGYAILQQGVGADATWLCVKYSPHGGAHGHPDKNHFILYSKGEVVAPDSGTHAYGSPLHKDWDKITLAHNTLTVDEKSQQPAQGLSLAFGRAQGVDFSITDAGPIYPGVRFVRTAAMLTPQLILFVDQVRTDTEHTFDLVYRQTGAWDALPTGEHWTPPPSVGYNHITGATSRIAGKEPLVLKTKATRKWQGAVTLAGGAESTEVITGYGILRTTEDLVPLLIQRRKSLSTAFVWAVSLDGQPVKLAVSSVDDASGKPIDRSAALMVQVGEGEHRRQFLINPDKQTVSATLTGGTVWQTTDALAVR